jgi:hypothetical protein
MFFNALHMRVELRHYAVILIVIMTSEADKNSLKLTVHGLSIDARLKNLEGTDYLPPAAF